MATGKVPRTLKNAVREAKHARSQARKHRSRGNGTESGKWTANAVYYESVAKNIRRERKKR